MTSGAGPRSVVLRGAALLVCLTGLWAAGCAGGPGSTDTTPPAAQNPSPMVETTRRHDRLPETRPEGARVLVDAGLDRPVEVFVTLGVARGATHRLLVHFHGASHVAQQAVVEQDDPYILAVVNLGAGSSRYEEPFRDPARLAVLVEAVAMGIAGTDLTSVGQTRNRGLEISGVYLSAFSAGCGAIRAILASPEGRGKVSGALLLDGLHTAYIPPRTVLSDGGRLDTERLGGVLAFARDAVSGRVTLVITHSTVFPGTFASTTETADWLLGELGLPRRAVLEWGPVGMQQLSEAGAGRFTLLGFAGNAAPDHVDHLHGLGTFLSALR